MKTFVAGTSKKLIKTKIYTLAPSNIALVKYWGKRDFQIPLNPSVSFSLNKAQSKTEIEVLPIKTKRNLPSVEFTFEKKPSKIFSSKVNAFLNHASRYCPWLLDHHLVIDSENNFPHSSGIASSASSMASMAIGIMQIENQIFENTLSPTHLLSKASFLARLGSGSAARSIEGPMVIWGESSRFPKSNNQYGVRVDQILELHPIFKTFCNAILIIDSKSKKVSSSTGHHLMNDHPYRESRILQAHNHLEEMKEVLTTGDLSNLIPIVEREALSLHSLMMSSSDYYLLFKPNTVQAINEIIDFRKSTKLPIMFTLDAGPNIHVLYPQALKTQVEEFIKLQLKRLCLNNQILFDGVGPGATWSFSKK